MNALLCTSRDFLPESCRSAVFPILPFSLCLLDCLDEDLMQLLQQLRLLCSVLISRYA
jgi:hypothetical protein